MVYIIALTGGIGSGKSTISKKFIGFNVSTVDCDVISRQAVKPGTAAYRAIINYFGTKVINNKGFLNRRFLRKEICLFSKKREWLNSLLHPIIYQESQNQIKHAVTPYVLWISPLLIENKLYKKADRVLVVDVEPETQIRRTMMRDGISREQAKQILSIQASREERLSFADDVIDNNGLLNSVMFNILQLHRKYLYLSHQRFFL